jgi:hypothetical protein
MFTRSVIGYDPPEQVTLDPFSGWGSADLAPAPASTPFDWGSIWSGTKEVLTTGADIFSKVYPAVMGTGPQTYPYKPGVPTPINPQTGQPYQINPQTGQLMIPQQAGATPAWLWPVVAGVGGFILITSMGKGRR